MARARAKAVPTEIELPALTGPQIDILNADERLLLVEGSPRSAKSWGVAFKLWMLAWKHPGIQMFYCRYKDEELAQLRDIWSKVSVYFPRYLQPRWNTQDQSWDFPNGRWIGDVYTGSRVYLRSLRVAEAQTSDAIHGKYKGLTLAVIVVEEASEVPRIHFNGLRERLSQSKTPDGTPHDYPLQLICVTNCVEESGNWIAEEWPEGSDEPHHRRTIRVSLASNAHNLGPVVMAGYERDFPPGHPLRPTVIEGRRGVTLVGKPVYRGYFIRDIHVSDAVRRDPLYPVLVGWDFGQEKPAAVFLQYLEHLGALRILGAVKGIELYLHVFAPKVLEIQQRWFGDLDPRETSAWGDPTGDTGNGGLEQTPIRMLHALDVPARFDPKANQAAVRYGAIQAVASFLGREARDGSPAFLMHPCCIELEKVGATIVE